ncbi:MAG: GntR family transcriptional regulator [Proteobacteria bacterium]|nr:GntR family transcriptional regulator [Pseudomonadota bacterium]
MSTTSTISREIADTLRTEILRQQYRCGERLPSERDLAARYNASRGAVREALSQLEQNGLISIHPGGARVQPIESASIAILGPLMNLSALPDPELVSQFLRTFAALATDNAKEAVEKANAEQLIRMKSLLVLLNQHAGDVETMQPHWINMLEYMATIADNLVVRLIGNDLKAQFVDQMMNLGLKPQLNKKNLNQVLNNLKQSLAKRDSELAGSAVQMYFNELRISIVADIKSRLANLQKRAG